MAVGRVFEVVGSTLGWPSTVAGVAVVVVGNKPDAIYLEQKKHGIKRELLFF